MALYEIDNLPGVIDFDCGSDFTRRTVQNAKNLLMCRKGEVPFDRQRGLNPAILDLPMTELRAVLLRELDRVMLWEPDAEVVRAEATIENGQTVIRCVIEIPDSI